MQIIRAKELVQKVGLSRMHIHRLEKAGCFPKRFQLGPNSVAWDEEEIDGWLEEKAKVRVEGAHADTLVVDDTVACR